MDGNGRINLRNWEFLEPQIPFRSHLGLQLMPSMDEKPLFGGGGVREHHQSQPPPVMSSINGGPFHHHRVGGISESRILMDYWMNQSREKYLNNVFNGNLHPGYYQPSNYGVSPETSSVHSIQLPPQITLSENKNVALPVQACNPQVEEVLEETENGSVALPMKRGGGKASKSPSKEKKPRTRAPRAPKNDSTTSVHRARAPKKCAEVFINGVNMDIYGIAIPVCSCTGNPQQCYRWGSGGWQSACCTTSLSMYPLPMSTKRRGARISGRKMSIGAFKKVLEKLASEGYNFSNPIDLRTYWAKHGTNKFVTIR